VRIGFVTEYYRPYVIGGAETSVHLAATSLALRGHDVTVFTPDHKTVDYATDEDGYDWDGPVRVARYWSPRAFSLRRGVQSVWFRNRPYYWYTARFITRHARRLGIVVLQAQTAMVQIPTLMAARRLRIPCVCTIRDMTSLCPLGSIAFAPCEHRRLCYLSGVARCALRRSHNPKFLLDVWLKYRDMRRRQRALMRYDAIVFPSHGYRDVYYEHGFAVPRKRTHVIYNMPPKATWGESAGSKDD